MAHWRRNTAICFQGATAKERMRRKHCCSLPQIERLIPQRARMLKNVGGWLDMTEEYAQVVREGVYVFLTGPGDAEPSSRSRRSETTPPGP